MAILKQGILGGGRGAVGTVVMSQWRGKDVIRARVTPRNPNTAAHFGCDGARASPLPCGQSPAAGPRP